MPPPSATPSIRRLHERYVQQAGWTSAARAALYRLTGLAAARRVLEVGCGTGVVCRDLPSFTGASVFGLDLDLAPLRFARGEDRESRWVNGDARTLPFVAGAFDAVLCHFFLLWVHRPEAALAEMARVLRPGGWLLCLAEPDYGGRLDAPPPLGELGALQTRALQEQGADPFVGRRLPALLAAAGLEQVRYGILGAESPAAFSTVDWELEWATLRADLNGVLSSAQLDEYQRLDRRAWQHGERVLFVPTFYAWGRRPTA
jgi:SAM-dependent methyltransferase